MNIKVGDVVARKSYNLDVLFRVIEVKDEIVYLLGEDVRLAADAPLHDVLRINDEERQKRQRLDRDKVDSSYHLFRQDYHLIRQKNEYNATGGYVNNHNYFQMPGRVLHIDGDPIYLKKCLTLYERIGVPVYGVHCTEKEMPDKVESLIDKYRPDILVITGHDSYSKSKGKITDLKAYRYSRQYAQTVRAARRKIPHLDQLVIFAGACQSHFESLIQAGANFASSPKRVNIHALDPVYIVAKVSFTPFDERINVWDVLRNTLTGEKGIGGIETKGVLRTGMPFQKHEDEK
ncbi:sporulation peptidase YabG [Ferdinandcohnia quinoae]|uniref:Sporulation peptidase YabG n=1 Tax=Fredinandcohnia quinoae TaxID=2918902 RepID=A0AAW5E6T0_9BACI|nr:sporulation peptidase YabG [Fredinandcohnia sp. SECRCQ15]MCH1626945.1 sporulation peptidase YabG [Fredinandcohnia sp. SECRCQ15]